MIKILGEYRQMQDDLAIERITPNLIMADNDIVGCFKEKGHDVVVSLSEQVTLRELEDIVTGLKSRYHID